MNNYDVVICGGGLAGLTLARQIRRTLPSLSIAVLDRHSRPLPVAAFKVGEATTEIGSFYLSEVIGLRDYLEESHIRKLGLRFFFTNRDQPFHKRSEIGLTKYIAPYAYNIDRGLFESDLRAMLVSSGVDLLENCRVRDVIIADGVDETHQVFYQNGDTGEHCLRARWIVDAMGRRRFLQRKFKLSRSNRVRFSAAWFRMEGRIDVSDFVSSNENKWHARVPDGLRYYSTNHLCGSGYWIWLIGLPSHYTSIGLVADENVHPYRSFNSYEKLFEWFERYEPHLAQGLAGKIPEDFLRMPRYSYSAKQVFSEKRWACVGEAATFVDPLYGTGTDMIGLANCMTTELIKKDIHGQLGADSVEHANLFFLSFNDGLASNVFPAYSCMGHALAMAMKSIWDTMAGWSFTAPILFNALYLDTGIRHRVWPESGKFFSLAHRVQQLFQQWSAKSPSRGHFDFINYLELPFVKDIRLRNLRPNKTEQELIDDHYANLNTFEEFAQIVFLLALEDTKPHRLAELGESPWINPWGMSLDESRWQQDQLFVPRSQPRDLRSMWHLLRERISFPTPTADSEPVQLSIVESLPLDHTVGLTTTLQEALRQSARGSYGVIYVNMDGTETRQSYRELLQNAGKVCAGLQRLGLKSGDVVILQLTTQKDFLEALWGCLLGGFIATPIAVPDSDEQSNSAVNRLRSAWQMLDNPLVITSDRDVDFIRSTLTDKEGVNCRLTTLEQLGANNGKFDLHEGHPDEVAILLLTSGSTGLPKAVQLRHRNILLRAEGRIRHFGFSERDVSVNWFPLDHVASLVMFHMRDVYLGCQQVHAPTRLALKDPLLWLEWLSRYSATISWAPNFAYALVNDHHKEIQAGNWDLSKVRCLLNGGEPIDIRTARTFLGQLSQHGLRKDAVYPDWGMTELSSGVVCPNPIDADSHQGNEFSLGRPIPGVSFRVVDDHDHVIAESYTGRVQVSGQTVTSGYYRDPERSESLFTTDGWLDTGDVGFLKNGQLTITGRNKEVVIINGINFNYSAIEEIVEQIDDVLVSYTAACSVRPEGSQSELLAIFYCATHDQLKRVTEQVKTIRQHIAKNLGITPTFVIPVHPHQIPKTSIGKIQRSTLIDQIESGVHNATIERFSSCSLDLPREAPATEVERKIADVWSNTFEISSPDIHQTFFELGGHSLMAFRILSELQDVFGVEVTIADLFDAPSIRLLAERITKKLPNSSGSK
jgi:acyl-CoA synthetase (AMP-forming)/AMP-acid ligase II/flavin-dependent dehydrogenase/acyl carrier protein